jgi:uncharacterized membrane protein YedE/YeeE
VIAPGIRGATGAAVHEAWIHGLIGGAMLGLASALLLFSHGRIAGISGIVGSLLGPATLDRGWRFAFLFGLAAAGVFASIAAPHAIGGSVRSYPWLVVAGLLVGFGTRLGGGCTSGHGVCGMGRLSGRSMVAVAVFTCTGALTALVAGGVS